MIVLDVSDPASPSVTYVDTGPFESSGRGWIESKGTPLAVGSTFYVSGTDALEAPESDSVEGRIRLRMTLDPRQRRAGEVGTGDVRSRKVGVGEYRAREIEAAQVLPRQDRIGHNSPAIS